MSAGNKLPFHSIFSKEQGQSWGFVSDRGKVHISGASAGVSLPVNLQALTCGSVTLTMTTASAGSKTSTIKAALGASTAMQIRGFSIWNQSTANRCEVRLELATYIVYAGGLAPKAAFNWNMIGAYHQRTNQAIEGWIGALGGGATVIFTVHYKVV